MRGQRQTDNEGCALILASTFYRNLSPVQLDEMLDNGKTKSQPAMHPRRGTISLSEAIEDVWQKFRSDAYARVTYRNLDVRSNLAGFDSNVTTLRSKLDGVG